MPSIAALDVGIFPPEAAPASPGGPVRALLAAARATRAGHELGHPAVRLAAAPGTEAGSW